MPDIKTDCFGYNKVYRQCMVLRETYCRKEECTFYKTREQYQADKEKYERRTEE